MKRLRKIFARLEHLLGFVLALLISGLATNFAHCHPAMLSHRSLDTHDMATAGVDSPVPSIDLDVDAHPEHDCILDCHENHQPALLRYGRSRFVVDEFSQLHTYLSALVQLVFYHSLWEVFFRNPSLVPSMARTAIFPSLAASKVIRTIVILV